MLFNMLHCQMNKNTVCLWKLKGISFVTGGHQQVQTSKYFNSITSYQHRITSITQLKECLKQCDKFYAKVVFNLSKKLHKVVAIFSGFIQTVELCGETVELCGETVEIL